MIAKLKDDTIRADQTAFQQRPLWTGPSKLATIRTAKLQPFQSLLKPSHKEPTAFRKKPRTGPIHLGAYGFDSDERAYPPHQNNSRAVLQYNPNHYPAWKRYLEEIKIEYDERRDVLLDMGGFGENICAENSPDTPPMDETSMCIGDLVSFQTDNGTENARIRVNGPRLPCYKLNHRFGISNMSLRTQEQGWTGWLYHVEKQGDVEVGNQMVLLERPFPQWPLSRIQHYCFIEPRNIVMIKEAVDTLGEYLAVDHRELFSDRIAKGVEDFGLRLQGYDGPEKKADFRLAEKSEETDRVTRFVFERVKKLPMDSSDFAVARSGSHVRLYLKIDNEKTIVRQYSVVWGNSNRFCLGVSLAADSRGGSAFLHKTLKVDDVLEASEKFANTFPLASESADEHIFFAGGIGITAFLDHIKCCLATKQKFHLHYMMRKPSDYAFKQMIEEMLANADDTAQLTTYFSANGRRCDLKKLLTDAAKRPQTHMYVCGSEKMVEDFKLNTQQLEIPTSRVHVEQFNVDSTGDPFTVQTNVSKKTIGVGGRQSLLDALREAGLEVPSSCEAGNCGTCRIKVKCGRIIHKGFGLIEDEKAGYDGKEEGDMLSCVSRAVGTIVVEL